MKKDMPESCTGHCRTYLKNWMWSINDEKEIKSDDANITDINPSPFYSTE